MSKKTTKKRGRGRPPKKGGKLDLRVQFAIDAERKAKYERAASDQGLELSMWIRRACDAAADEQLGESR